MTPVLRHAWLQKHPTPAATRGEFHWYPAEGDRELRTSIVERSRGVDAPAVLWHLAPGRASWAQTFAATAPTDGRRYVGLVLTIAEADGATPAELLEAIELPAAAPWTEAGAAVAARGGKAWAVDAGELPVAAIARALLGGGDAVLAEPAGADLPGLIASVERWLPASATGKPRAGAWRTGVMAAMSADRVAGLVEAAWREPAGRAALAWTLLCELAVARDRSLDEVAAELADEEGALTEAERAAVGEPRDFTAALHAWGRGRLDASTGAASLPARLADGVALRVLACLIAGRDPRAPIAEARWHALLPAARRTVLLETVVRRAASLRALVGGA